MLELVKNSYDAFANKCEVTMIRPETGIEGKIIILDDGDGMDYETLSTVWLEIGTDKKKHDVEKMLRNKKDKYARIPIGEKGIGRLGVHRLGREIEVVSKKEKSYESVMKINWDKIEETKYIEDLPVEVFQRPPETFKTNASGTQITITRLRVPWTRKMARDCARSLMSLNSPFESDDSFNVKFDIVNSDWIEGILKYEDVQDYSLFSFDILISGNKLVKFDYEFKPWETLDKLESRLLTMADKEIYDVSEMIYKVGNNYMNIDLSHWHIGDVQFKGVIFDRDPRILQLGVQDKSGFKKYLNRNGGIRVYRNNMRVMDYGEVGNDWLNLGGRRINMPAKRISNNIILGAVYLNRKLSGDLVEKSNREGFVENNAYLELLRAITFAIDRIETHRQSDKDLLRKYYGPQKIYEPVTSSLTELISYADKNIRSDTVKKEIHKYLDRIANEYEFITESLIKSAGAGLNLIMIIHQMEQMIKSLRSMIKKNASLEVIGEIAKQLSNLVEGYSIIVKHSDKKFQNITPTIDQSISNLKYRLKFHKIKIRNQFKNRDDIPKAFFAENHVINALMNVIDNSIWWLEYKNINNREILIDITYSDSGFVNILLADNGPGFSLPTSEIIKPFITNKPGGMGIGLHLTHQIMLSLGGKILFPTEEMVKVPKKFMNGAKIILAFKKGK